MKLRSDYRAAVIMKNRLHHESGEPIEEPIHPGQQRRIRRGQEISQKITCPALELINIQDGNIGLQLQVPRGGTNLNGVGSEFTIFFCSNLFFCYSWFRLQLIAIHCNRRGGEQNTLTQRIFSHICTHFILVHMHRMVQGDLGRVL